MIKELDKLSGDEIVKKELATGVPIVYYLDDEGNKISSETLTS
jgi:2,3-bisphosphoglycerate-dependent phosphoglycerate mutase